MIKVKLQPEKAFTNVELKKIKKENPDLKFEMKIEKGKQYIYMEINENEKTVQYK